MPDEPNPTPAPAPVIDEPAPAPVIEEPAPVPVEVEPQKEPPFVNWTAAEKEEVYEALKKIRQSEPAPIDDNKPEPKQPEPKRRKFRFKSKRG